MDVRQPDLAGTPADGTDAPWRDDWPPRGVDPDRDAHDPPHPASGAEWWWFTTRLWDGGREHGLVFQFLRHSTPTASGDRLASHAVIWSLGDRDSGSHQGESWVDQGVLDLVREMAAFDDVMDPRVGRAVVDSLAGGRCPTTDRLFPRPARWTPGMLDLDFGGVARLHRDERGDLIAEAEGEHTGFRLRLSALKQAIPQWNRTRAGRTRAGAMYTYCVPRLAAQGTLLQDGRRTPVSGEGWYEHAFGDSWYDPKGQGAADLVWMWAGLSLDNGWELAAFREGEHHTAHATTDWKPGTAVLCSPQGERIEAPATLRHSRPWISLATLNTYPMACEIEVPHVDLRVEVRTWFPQQEHRSVIFHSGMLEAQADAQGTMGGRPVRGRGLWEIFPSNRIGDFERYITRVRDATLHEIDRLYPEQADPATVSGLAAAGDAPGRVDGVVDRELHAALVAPVRHAVRGLGKSWRSYVITAAIEMFGADSDPYRPLMGAVEIFHSGNLIIDDVEDRSALRRGRPAAHLVFGEDTAVNSGTAAYFVLDRVLRDVLPDDDRLRRRVYERYLEVLRAGHAGQAIDLAGHRAAMDAAVETGEAEKVLRRIRAAHRLKSAVPVRGLAEIGALIAGATDAQVRAAGDYFEAVGLAYQISDDVMDLRGLTAPAPDGEHTATKHRAEDLSAGKVTMPLAHAVALLPAGRMRDLWHAVRDGGADPATVAGAAAALEECGAVTACTQEAQVMVEQAWKPLQDLAPCTWASMMMRALGAYAARRERE
ncbi:polyprenyl synthetase family protein [Nocardiopsis mangrovi]|uniref:Polyprenyl synthetase family protein n=1 Tax=Nocardiopsis mangrovi TaxID=1179818 RepID=A0ABV9E6N9_9ACTN